MRYVDQGFSEIEEPDFFRKIALAAHNCYQVAKPGDDRDFVGRLLGYGHYAMLEHYVFAAETGDVLDGELRELADPFVTLAEDSGKTYAAFSLRPLLEHPDGPEAYKHLAALLPAEVGLLAYKDPVPAERPAGRLLSRAEVMSLGGAARLDLLSITLRLVTDRGVSHELVRHRRASYAQESTRYCNYSKDRFCHEITCIRPLDYESHKEIYDAAFGSAEQSYFSLLAAKAAPEMARAVLPSKLKTSVIITASLREYLHIFDLRLSPRAHPDIRALLLPVQAYFRTKGYLTDEGR